MLRPLLLAVLLAALALPAARAEAEASVDQAGCHLGVVEVQPWFSALVDGGCFGLFWFGVRYTDANCAGGQWVVVLGLPIGNAGVPLC